MTLSIAALRTVMYNWAVANVPSGKPVIYLYNNGPRPDVEYVTLFISTLVEIGRDYTQSPLSTSAPETIVGDREFTLQVVAYGDDPFTVCENLRCSLQKQTVLSTLRANGVAYVNWFPIVDTTTIVDTGYEQRASMDLLFRVANVYSDISGDIETTQIEEKFLFPGGSIASDITVTIPPG
jgi:hypothetical protein